MAQAARDLHVNVVDDNAAVRKSMCALLLAHGYSVSSFESAEHFLAQHSGAGHQCVLLDLRMPGMSGLDLQRHLRRNAPDIPLIILTGHGDISSAVEAMRAGAIDFIEKPGSEDQLLRALDSALQVACKRSIAPEPVENILRRYESLTDREREVVDHLILGRSNREIAGELGLSQRTVEIHRAHIREKMGASRLSDIVRMMLKIGK
ncbi:MAG: response regulator [Rhizobiales bacterium]|nr:response regulator [Hyphomicrobiales bacterium]